MLLFVLSLLANLTFGQAELNIVYTNDLEGSVGICGCASDPGGGVTRRLNWLEDQKLDPTSTIYLNAGNTLFSELASLEHEDKAEKLGAKIMLDSMSYMDLTAFTPGRSDFKKGVDFFNTASKKYPVVISNTDSAQYLKSLILKKGTWDIVVLGILQSEVLKVSDPIKALKKQLKTLKRNGKHRPFVVLLLYSDQKLLNEMAKKINGIDLVLSEGLQEEAPQPILVGVGKTSVIRLLNGGDSIGLLKVKKTAVGVYEYTNSISFLGPKYERKNKLSSDVQSYIELKRERIN